MGLQVTLVSATTCNMTRLESLLVEQAGKLCLALTNKGGRARTSSAFLSHIRKDAYGKRDLRKSDPKPVRCVLLPLTQRLQEPVRDTDQA